MLAEDQDFCLKKNIYRVGLFYGWLVADKLLLYSVGVLCLVSDPWGAPRVRSLLTGKVEQQQQVLELVSSEGVDLVLLRIGRDTKNFALLLL
jgi:hypothetical protein